MKSKIAVLFLIVLLCLTSGCSNTSQIAEQPAPVSSSESNKAPYQSETAQATEKTEVEQPRSTEPKDDDRSTEVTVGVLDSSIQTKPASEQPNSGTTPPQVSEPSKTPDESERHPEVSAPSEKEQPTPPATEEPKPAEQLQPTEPPQEEPTEPAFDIGYWIGFAKSYAESVGLTLNSEAVYCWDNPIAAGSQCKYTERDIKHPITKAVLAPMKAVKKMLVSMELHLDASIDKLDNLAMNVQIDKEKHTENEKKQEQTEPEMAEAKRVEAEIVYSPMVAEPQEYQYNADAFEARGVDDVKQEAAHNDVSKVREDKAR